MAVTSFIPEIWSARLLEHLDKAHVYAALMNKDYEGEIRNAGDTVHINTIGDITVGTYTGTAITYEDLATTDQELKIDQSKYFAFQVDDVEKAQALPSLVEAATQRAAYAINDAADAYLAGVLAAGGTAMTAASLTAANIYENLVAIKVKLDQQNVPTEGRWVVVDPQAHGLLLQDQRFVSFGTDITNERLVNGRVGRAVGMDIYVSNNVPKTTASNVTTYSIIAGVPMACTYAEQIIETEALRSETTFKDKVRGLHVYGAKVTMPTAIAVLPATYAQG